MKEHGILVEEGELDVEFIELTSDHPALQGIDWKRLREAGLPVDFIENPDEPQQGDETAAGLDQPPFEESVVLEDTPVPEVNGASGHHPDNDERFAMRMKRLEERNHELGRNHVKFENPAAILNKRLAQQLDEKHLWKKNGTAPQAAADDNGSVTDTAMVQQLKDRLQESSHALSIAREEIERLKADRLKLASGLTERGKLIETLNKRLVKTNGHDTGGSAISRLFGRILPVGPSRRPRKEERSAPAPMLAPEPVVNPAPPQAARPVPVAAAPVLARAPAPEPEATSLPESPLVEMLAPAIDLPRVVPPPAVAVSRPGRVVSRDIEDDDTPIIEIPVRRYLVGLGMVGRAYEIKAGRITVGRTHDNDLPLADVTVSRAHGTLRLRGPVLMVFDSNSRNGVFINNVKVQRGRLRDGDLLAFGEVQFRYRVEPAMESAADDDTTAD